MAVLKRFGATILLVLVGLALLLVAILTGDSWYTAYWWMIIAYPSLLLSVFIINAQLYLLFYVLQFVAIGLPIDWFRSRYKIIKRQ